jgi:hypothetical protein
MPSSLDKNPDLAVGLKLPFGPGQSNFALNFTTVDQTKTNLMNLLLTQKGERFMQPNFGTDLRRILFEPNDERIESRIKQEKVSTIREVKQIDEYTVNVIITFSLKADAFSQSSIQFAFGSDSSVEVS